MLTDGLVYFVALTGTSALLPGTQTHAADAAADLAGVNILNLILYRSVNEASQVRTPRRMCHVYHRNASLTSVHLFRLKSSGSVYLFLAANMCAN